MIKNFVHETSIIDEGAIIGKGSKIWHWSHICSNSKIGDNCVLSQNTFVVQNVTIGNGCKIQNNVSLYDGVILEDNVFCGPSVVFTNVYNPRSEINRKKQFLPTIVKSGATIGANATIICGRTIGSYAFIGAGSVVNKDIKPFSLVVGVPAKQIGWVNVYGERLNLPLKGHEIIKCYKTDHKYELRGNNLYKTDL